MVDDVNANKTTQNLPNVVGSEFLKYFDVEMSDGDLLLVNEGQHGRKWTTISKDPLSVGVTSTARSKFTVKAPVRFFFEMSVSQRYKGDYCLVYLANYASGDETVRVPSPVSISIASIQQTTTTLTIVLNDQFDGGVGDWVNITNVPDNRLNYFNLCIATVSLDKKTLTATVNDEVTIPSLTVGPYTSVGTLTRIEPFSLANNAVGLRTSGVAETSNAVLSRFGGAEGYWTTGTAAGGQLITTASTAPVYAIGTTGQYSIGATSRYMLDFNAQEVTLNDRAVDALASFTTRQVITNVKPDDAKEYRLVIDCCQSSSQPVPVAKIVSAVKTGTTTATITTDVPHGLNALSYVQTYGIRDLTNFPNLASATLVSSIVSPTVFTIVIAGAVTATSYGGGVTVCNGGQITQGLIGQTVQSVARDADGLVTVVGNTTWSGMVVGGLVNLYGVRSAVDGSDLGFDGAYRVLSLSTTTLILGLVTDYKGVVRSPTGGVVTTTNCGGAVLDRVEYRTHDLGIETYTDNVMTIRGQGKISLADAIPVTLAATGTVSATQSTAATISSTTGLGGWYIHPAVTGITDIASAALTSTSTSSSISNNLGNAFQVNIAVTATSGTTPTLDLRIQESFDGGTNWETLYDFQRITANGSYNSPVLRSVGRHIRYVRTVAGTSPSFTNAVVRNVLPFSSAEPQKRLVDRTIVLTTLNSVTPTLFMGAANNVQLVINVGAITTTAPAIQVEGSEDGGATFYPIGTPLTAVASSTVEVTVPTKSATHLRARVSTAGVGVTAGYVSLKAWS